jgi:hypothetical protein
MIEIGPGLADVAIADCHRVHQETSAAAHMSDHHTTLLEDRPQALVLSNLTLNSTIRDNSSLGPVLGIDDHHQEGTQSLEVDSRGHYRQTSIVELSTFHKKRQNA